MSAARRNLPVIIFAAVALVIVIAVGPGRSDHPNDFVAPVTQAPSATRTAQNLTLEPLAPQKVMTEVRVQGLEPVGGVRRISVQKGRPVAFRVHADTPDGVRLDGYGIEKPVGPGRPATFRFLATIAGVFKVNLEQAGNQLIELRVVS